jgi:tetratricopeptide (TPR) repeat protein
MNDPPKPADETLAIPQVEGPGGRIGPFKILQQIGEGGFGSVFEAEQEKPVKRRVALKVIKLGMDTREVIARFEAERQALALMDHPHIARVLDAGATDSGRPYFVMELVKGEPISSYCSKHKLPIADRLHLFGQVCEAVQHAHTKGIIHRDLKPNNVLVSTQDDRPFAKVIDFGIAKATSGRLTDKTLFTEMNLMMGTPLYMSPEQAEGSADIDTRTDIYSLGVILYELLTDTTPIDSNTLRTAGYAEIQRIIREVEPPRPSARLSKSTTTRLGAEARQPGDSRKLTKMVRGELDWIVMKAIEKDRSRRYETANGLAMDIRRYLAGEAVLAAPPSATYRLRKIVRRYKGAVAAGSLIAVSLLVGIAGFAWQTHIARQQAVRAQQQEQLAQQRAKDLEQVANFEATMLGQVDPVRAGKLLSDDMRSKYAASLVRDGVSEAERDRQLAALDAIWQRVNVTDTARDLIDNTILRPAVATIDKQFKSQPLVDAYLRQTLADRYFGMGLWDDALPLQQSALATRRRFLGDDNRLTLDSMIATSALLRRMGKPAAAEPIVREALRRLRRVAGDNDPATVRALSLIGVILYDDGRFGESEAYERQVLAIQRRVLGEDAPGTLVELQHLGLLLMYEYKSDQAEPLLREAVTNDRRVLGEESPDTVLAIETLGFLLEREGKLDQAEAYEREALDKSRRGLGEDSLFTLNAASLAALVLDSKGDYAEAEKLLAPIEAGVRRRFVGSYSFMRATYFLRLGIAHTGLRDYAGAETELLEAQSIAAQTHNITHTDDIRDCTRALAALYKAWDKADPGKGHGARATEWKDRADALGAPATAPNPSNRATASGPE